MFILEKKKCCGFPFIGSTDALDEWGGQDPPDFISGGVSIRRVPPSRDPALGATISDWGIHDALLGVSLIEHNGCPEGACWVTTATKPDHGGGIGWHSKKPWVGGHQVGRFV